MIETQIICDRCFRVGATSTGKNRKHAHQMRQKLKKEGWKDLTPCDLCPECAEQEKINEWKREM